MPDPAPHFSASSPPLPLSVAIVCKNNQDTIERTLASVAPLAAEIVAVDSGSTDGTIPLLERYGARVIASPWLGHIRTKQLALEHCTRPWVLCIDSDESIEPDLAASIREAITGASTPSVGEPNAPSPRGYLVNRKVYYRGEPLRHAWQPEWRLRLIRRGLYRWNGLDPHDYLDRVPLSSIAAAGDAASAGASPAAAVPSDQRLNGTMRHDSISTFADFFVKQASHARTMARSLHAAGKRGSVLRLCISPAGAFFKQVVMKQAWRDGVPGWLAASATAAGTLIKHAVLLELTHTGGDVKSGMK